MHKTYLPVGRIKLMLKEPRQGFKNNIAHELAPMSKLHGNAAVTRSAAVAAASHRRVPCAELYAYGFRCTLVTCYLRICPKKRHHGEMSSKGYPCHQNWLPRTLSAEGDLRRTAQYWLPRTLPAEGDLRQIPKILSSLVAMTPPRSWFQRRRQEAPQRRCGHSTKECCDDTLPALCSFLGNILPSPDCSNGVV